MIGGSSRKSLGALPQPLNRRRGHRPTDIEDIDFEVASAGEERLRREGIGGFNISVTDYWFNTGLDPENRYFKYDAHGTNHLLEANVGYDFGFASLQWFTNFAGNDGANKNGKRAYSSYFELSAPFKLASVDWTATAGAVPYATDFYGTTGFAVTNVSLRATKDIRVTDTFSLPIFGQVMANPCSQKAYLVFGFTLQP